jgi:hypothetical protein
VAALARFIVKYKKIVTSGEAERQTPCIEIRKNPAALVLPGRGSQSGM